MACLSPRRIRGEALGQGRHGRRLDIGEGDAEIFLLTRAEHAAGQRQHVLLVGQPPRDLGRGPAVEGMGEIGEIGPGADQAIAEIGRASCRERV